MTAADTRTAMAVAREAALAGAEVIARASTEALEVSNKGAVDLVTQVDLASEAAVQAVLSARMPGVPVLAEEAGGARSVTTRWIVDPLDGTTNFVHGLPHYGPSIALEVDGVVQVGVVMDVGRGELFRASLGHGAYRNDRPIRVSTVESLRHALVATGFGYDRAERPDFYLERVKRVFVALYVARRLNGLLEKVEMMARSEEN